MWLKEKIIKGESRTLLRPEKVEYIHLLDLPIGQGDGCRFAVGIDGVEYISCQKLNFPAGTGICFIEAPEGPTYWCDDSIIITALTRFWLTYHIKLDYQWPKPGYVLPLLTREESRKYLEWHQIPHPGVW